MESATLVPSDVSLNHGIHLNYYWTYKRGNCDPRRFGVLFSVGGVCPPPYNPFLGFTNPFSREEFTCKRKQQMP